MHMILYYCISQAIQCHKGKSGENMQFKQNETIYTQIEKYLKKRIFTGECAPGERLPAIREFAVLMKVNPNTIVKVYADLEQEELIFSERTNGKFVTDNIELLRVEKSKFIQNEVRDFLSSIKDMTENEQDIINYIRENYGNV
ncbi:MAG: GntR family transcriptional regulator [Clostridia bacterium]|nr:GntR family transcriptional regulator [Clostridia bacterium]